MQPEKRLKTSNNETIELRAMEEVKDNFVKFTNNESDKYSKNDRGPFFVIIKHTKDNEKISDMKVGKILHEIQANGITKVEKVNLYSVKVTLKTPQDANNLLKNEKLKNKEVKSYIPNNILTKKGVVSDVPTDITIKEIAQSIKSNEKIISVQRMTRRNRNFKIEEEESTTNKKFIESNKIIVTFRAQTLPEKVEVFFTPRKVDIYRPRVKFCNNCQNYGHINSAKFPCRNQKCCAKCGLSHEESEKCEISCKFCKKNHQANSKDCEKFKLEERAQLEAMYSNRMIQEIKKDLQQQNYSSNNFYDILSTQQQFPDLEETEDTENSRQFMRKFSKRDERLSHNQNSRKIVRPRASYAEISSQMRTTEPSTSAKASNEIENEKRLKLVQRLRERQNRTKLDDILEEIMKDHGNDQEHSQNQLAKQLEGYMEYVRKMKNTQNTPIKINTEKEIETENEEEKDKTPTSGKSDDFLMES
jgi:hypothetical protein